MTDRAHQISSFGESERGELHVVNYSGGQILRLEQRCPEGQYRADYFPTANQGVAPQLSRCETGLNQDWGSGSPDPGLPSNGFSARWLGHHTFTAGSYRFIGQAEGGLRVYLDGQLLIDGWSVPSGTEVRAARVLTAGSHSIEVEYEERGGDASIELRWEPAGTANLSLSVSAAPDPVAVGSRLTYSLSVSNAGPQPADIQVVDTLPERVTYESSSVSQGAGCSLAGSTVTCLLGTLNQNGSATATIVVIPRPLSSGTTATLVNQATALSTDAGDPNLANNSVTTESDVKGLTRRPSPRGGNGSLSAEAESESEPEEADATPTPIPSPTPTATVATPSATPTATPRIAPSRPARR